MEELRYLPGDAVKVITYYARQLQLVEQWLFDFSSTLATTTTMYNNPDTGKVCLMLSIHDRLQRQLRQAMQVFGELKLICIKRS